MRACFWKDGAVNWRRACANGWRGVAKERYEEAGGYRDLLNTVEEIDEKQKIAGAQATIRTWWRGMQSRHRWLRTCFIFAAGAWWTARFLGKT